MVWKTMKSDNSLLGGINNLGTEFDIAPFISYRTTIDQLFRASAKLASYQSGHTYSQIHVYSF